MQIGTCLAFVSRLSICEGKHILGHTVRMVKMDPVDLEIFGGESLASILGNQNPT